MSSTKETETKEPETKRTILHLIESCPIPETGF